MQLISLNNLIIALCAVIIYSLFTIKEKVSHLRYQLNEAKRQTVQEQNSIHVLKAEFSWLSSPERLKKLSDSYLRLQPVKTSQLTRNPLPDDNYANTVISELTKAPKKPSRKVQWRYKKVSKYVQTVSHKSVGR